MPYSVYEKVQVTIFFIQELILSGLYVSETIKMMRVQSSANAGSNRTGTRRLMKHLVLVNIIIVLLDITILDSSTQELFHIQTAYKGLVYSVKLKLGVFHPQPARGDGSQAANLQISGGRGPTSAAKNPRRGYPLTHLERQSRWTVVTEWIWRK